MKPVIPVEQKFKIGTKLHRPGDDTKEVNSIIDVLTTRNSENVIVQVEYEIQEDNTTHRLIHVVDQKMIRDGLVLETQHA
jgi:hypothetical protein